jgi:hypothetical protein
MRRVDLRYLPIFADVPLSKQGIAALSPHAAISMWKFTTSSRGKRVDPTSMKISLLSGPNCHSRADAGKIDRKALRLYKLNLRFAHDKFSQLEMDMLFELDRMPPGQGAPWTPYMMIFFKRLLDSNYVAVAGNPYISINVGGIETTPAFLLITDKGRGFIVELGIHEL